MLTCPLCKKILAQETRACPRCRADLSILTDYAARLDHGLARADSLTRNGELGEAVWAYLEVLEVDPDNLRARQQVARIVTAVRQFDRGAQSQRWLRRLQRRERWRRWLASWEGTKASRNWLYILAILLVILIAFGYGYDRGRQAQRPVPIIDSPAQSPTQE